MINNKQIEIAKKKSDKLNDTELYFEMLDTAYRTLNKPDIDIKELWEEISLSIETFEEVGIISPKRSQRLEIINNINIGKMLKEGSEEVKKILIEKGEWYDNEDNSKKNIFTSRFKQ